MDNPPLDKREFNNRQPSEMTAQEKRSILSTVPRLRKPDGFFTSPRTYSQETERKSGSTGRQHRNPIGILKFTERPKTPGINIEKHGKL